LGDGPGRPQRRLVQAGVLGDRALDARTLVEELLAAALQLGDKIVDLLQRGLGHSLHQRSDVAGDIGIRTRPRCIGNWRIRTWRTRIWRSWPPARRKILAHELAHFAALPEFGRLAELGALTRCEETHDATPRLPAPD